MWKHVSKFKGQLFLGTYEYDKNGKRVLKLKNSKTGREIGIFGNGQQLKLSGWVKI